MAGSEETTLPTRPLRCIIIGAGYASSLEIQSYLKAVTLHYRLERFMKFNSKVEEAVWNNDCSRWSVKIEGGQRHESEILVNACGILNNPNWPELRGLDAFKGVVAHTAAWDSRIDVTGKRVAIVGAGASAIQVLPALQKQASHIDMYIRTPSWITPPAGGQFINDHNHTYSGEEIERFTQDPEYSLQVRKEMEASFNGMYKAFLKGSLQQHELRTKLEDRMRQLILSEDLQKRLIPHFEAGCRRLNPGERYLEALQQDNVEPIFESVGEVTPDGIQDNSGTSRPVDVVIFATGFDTSFRPRFPIVGTNGVDLRELWKDEPSSYCGLAVSGFPNHLIFLGPNTPISNGSLMGTLEGTADYFVRLIRKWSTQQALSFDVKQRVQEDFNTHTQTVMQKLVWTGSCRSWFKNSRGRITGVWPGSGLHYREFLQSDRWEDFEWRYEGNNFDYWGLGFSQIEREENPDLSDWIKPYPNIPLEALRRVYDDQGSRAVEQVDIESGEPTKLISFDLEKTQRLEGREGDCSSEDSVSSGAWNDLSSETSDTKATRLTGLSEAAAFSV
ncbi:hypothetical protein LTR10_022060 [Elasticomyces elasticus]|nr:hypothetical protein LTR10_022060 [Elasticomyces elasticus]